MIFLRYFFLYFVAICLYAPSICHAYSDNQIAHYVGQTPRNSENSLLNLATYLTKPFNNDYDKAKAIAFWIASHINYDEYIYTNGGTTRLAKHYDGQNPRELLKSRVGICGDFANLFLELCKKANIKAAYVSGYAYPANRHLTTSNKKSAGHAWNYFLYNGKKVYVDTTFMAKGTTGSPKNINQTSHRRALKQIKRDNRYDSQVNDFDAFYFDFTYSSEKHKRGYIHEER